MKSKALFAVAAAMFATSAALAAVSNLESYHLRHDFSTGERVALLGPQCTVDFIATGNETAVAGPNGAASAVHPTAANWGVVQRNGSNVSTDYLAKGDVVLIIDDFLANGAALRGLMDLCDQAGAEVAGVAIAIEKCFTGAGDALRAQGVRLESLAAIESMSEDSVVFRS